MSADDNVGPAVSWPRRCDWWWCRIESGVWMRSRSGCGKIIVLKLCYVFVADSTRTIRSVRSSSTTSYYQLIWILALSL